MGSSHQHVTINVTESNVKHDVSSPSPKNIKNVSSPRSLSSSPRLSPMCVCAPATHAGSFKCRLHRVNSLRESSVSSPRSPILHRQASLQEPSSNILKAK
ncbi:hypothetical protein ZOSMA_4G00870 [Zostera marina]|uniref:Serine-rich protein-like protein n=1 Tax=Zostera marina TaxID=29655 RepID=A0A0K9NYM0_ZOSMR|nr:hypothetical protein ZOSMA_4G00870 [Zostera marina]